MNNVVFFRQAFVGASLLLYGLSPAMAMEGEELIPNVGISDVQQQGRRVTCVISDKGGPIIGANVLVKGTNNGNISDMDGRVILDNVPNNAILVVSYIGYVTQEIPLKNSQTSIKVRLVSSSSPRSRARVLIGCVSLTTVMSVSQRWPIRAIIC